MKKTIKESDMLEILKYIEVIPENGKILWKGMGKNQLKGKEAGSISNSTRYRMFDIRINGKKIRTSCHKVIFYYFHRKIPKLIDHINRDRLDNRIINLREANDIENARNTNISKRNKSGAKGVSFCKYRNKWTVRIRHFGVYKNLGYYEDKEKAIHVRKEFVLKKHGEFASY